MNRRQLLRASVAAVPAALVPSALLASGPDDTRAKMLALIEQLEDRQGHGWESSCVVAAKAFVAYRMREAMGLDLPDAERPRLHIDFQRLRFDEYRRSYLFERDLAAGEVGQISEFERAL